MERLVRRIEFVILAAAGSARVWRWLRGRLGQGIASRAVETGETQLVPDALDAETPEAVGTGETSTGPFRSGIAVPVILHGTVFGVLATAHDRQPFTGRHVHLLRAFADHCATAIDNGRTGKSSQITAGR